MPKSVSVPEPVLLRVVQSLTRLLVLTPICRAVEWSFSLVSAVKLFVYQVLKKLLGCSMRLLLSYVTDVAHQVATLPGCDSGIQIRSSEIGDVLLSDCDVNEYHCSTLSWTA